VSGDPATADTLAGGARAGQVLCGKYQLVRLLGRGGMGEVYEARHLVVGRRFAAKFLHASPAVGSGAAARFLREAQAAGKLESPHIAAVLDFDVAPDGAPFLVMEYLPGESLSRVLRREERLSVPRVIGLLLQACAGLEVAHAAGIVHRDLKPDNLFLVQRPDGLQQLKIVDFGIAKLMSDAESGNATQSGAVLGTPYYMAPEQARGERSVDQRVDVHALGVIAYELLSGEKPHPGDSYNAILAHILTEPVEPLGKRCPSLPQELVTVIERAMAFEPAARQPTVAALARDLGRFAGRELRLRGEALDLAQPERGAPDARLETHADTSAAGDTQGTLQSAVGDVGDTSPGSRGLARWGIIGTVVLAAGWVWMLTRSAGSPAREPVSSGQARGAQASSVGSAELRPIDSAASRDQAPLGPNEIASSAASAAQSRASTVATSPSRQRATTVAPAAPQATGGASPPPAASYPAPAASQVTFDEKNPY
jgi:serine/threonine-protein kinase